MQDRNDDEKIAQYEMVQKKLSASAQADIINDTKKETGLWYGYFGENINTARADKLFYMGQQWNPQTMLDYDSEQKPTLVLSLIKPIVRIILGEIKFLDPQLNMMPIDTKNVDPASLRLSKDLLRSIAYNSQANLAYGYAAENMATTGWGVVQVCTRYVSDGSFDQEVYIRAIPDQLCVFFDPNAQLKTKADSMYQGMYQQMDKDVFKQKYPKASPATNNLFGAGVPFANWMGDDCVTIVEKYCVKDKDATLVLLTNGVDYKKAVYKDEVEETIENYYKELGMKGVGVFEAPPLIEAQTRKSKKRNIECYKLNGNEVLEYYDWPSKEMPFVFFDNDSEYKDGRQWTESYIRPAFDAQRTYNFAMSEAAYATEIARKERFLVTPKQLAGFQDLWKYPQKALAALPFNPDPMLPGVSPVAVPPAEISSAYFKLAEMAAYDVQRILGVYDPGKGMIGADISAATNAMAINQSNTSFKNIVQNLYIGMEQVGRVALDLVPNLYDTERVVPIQKPNGEGENVVINQGATDPETLEMVYHNDMTSILYKLEIKPGASFEMQKQTENAKMMQLATLDPRFPGMMGDKLAENIETPNALIIAKRLKTLVAPQIIAEEDGLPPPPPPPPPPEMEMMQQQMKLMQAQIDKMAADAQNDQQELILKAQKQEQDAMLNKTKVAVELHKSKVEAAAEIRRANDQEIDTKLKTASDLHKFHKNLDHEKDKLKVSVSVNQSRKKGK